MIDDSIRVLAGDCTVIAEGPDREEYRGRVTTLVKPDNTVLVHDVDGYQPVAWLTRADSVSSAERDFTLVAKKDAKTLRVAAHEEDGFAHYPASAAGTPVGPCPVCEGTLVRSTNVHCVRCGVRYGLPADATVHADGTRCDCGLPRMRVERGLAFDVCLDRDCESLDDAVRRAFDREWDCPEPECDGDLRILRRGGLIAGCERYPDCDTGFAVPAGVVDGRCGCGLPTFDARTGTRCLDATCERALEPAPAADTADGD